MPKSRTKQAKPIRLALLWHQHQPYYKAGNKFILPWVWLHATKDYLEMAQHLEAVPAMKATINLVPSLIRQIEEYLSGDSTDPLLSVFQKSTEVLTEAEKKYIIQNCFHANYGRMIARSARYKEIHAKVHDRNELLSVQDYRDLLVHYFLAWSGEFIRAQSTVQTLVEKDKDYTEEDKQALFDILKGNVAEILPLHKRLAERQQIELSTTPFYHPIMPLICDTNTGREAVPGLPLPSKRFREPDDARQQLTKGLQYFEERFGSKAHGIWPSEGSLSEEVLQIMIEEGVQWTATDEAVLTRTLSESVGLDANLPEANPSFAKYFPFKYTSTAGEIAIFFRDHVLSDNIGFVYQSWNADDAVNDFIRHILQVRNDLVTHYGEDVLDRACISVILDGENCWEYYEKNGYHFLNSLYKKLTEHAEIEVCTMNDALNDIGTFSLPRLQKLTPGSWINANFNIWIGHAEDNLAWEEVYKARYVVREYEEWISTLEGVRKEKAQHQLKLAREELMIAEGSDWCWWYGDDHFSAQKDQFDELFRMHLRAIYVYLDKRVPATLGESIVSRAARLPKGVAKEERPVYPVISGVRQNDSWSEIDEIDIRVRHGAMHKAEKLGLDELRAEMLSEGYFIRVVPRPGSPKDLRVRVELESMESHFEFRPDQVAVKTGQAGTVRIPSIEFAWNEVLELALRSNWLSDNAIPFAVTLISDSLNHSIRIPAEGWLRSR